MAVVDHYCRVRGVEGLGVVDASVMPNMVRRATTTKPAFLASSHSTKPWS
jgi:choline dehydrogenase-like flavoprotein